MPQKHPADKPELQEFYQVDFEKVKKLWLDMLNKKSNR